MDLGRALRTLEVGPPLLDLDPSIRGIYFPPNSSMIATTYDVQYTYEDMGVFTLSIGVGVDLGLEEASPLVIYSLTATLTIPVN